MRTAKLQNLVGIKWLWQFEDGERALNIFECPGKTYLVFGVFYLDKFEKALKLQLLSLQQRLQTAINEWNEWYPWSEYDGISLHLEEAVGGIPFIFGQICVEDNVVEEESIIVGILQKFSLECNSHVFVKVCDTDGDFLLGEASDALPEEYEYPYSNNRLWLHEGQFKMISADFYSQKGLQASEALHFLENMSYKLTLVERINTKISQRVTDKYPEKTLSNLLRLPLAIEDEKYFDLLAADPQIISLAIKNLINEEVKVEKEVQGAYAKTIAPLVPKRFCDMMSMFLDAQDLKKNTKYIPLYCGRAVSEVINILMQRTTFSRNLGGRKKSANKPFASHSFESATLDEEFDAGDVDRIDDNIMEKLAKFFEQDDILDAETRESEQNSQDEEDKQAREYFKNQGVGIDEDDFFEFFLTSALKMKENELGDMRSQTYNDHFSTCPDNMGLQDELSEPFHDDEEDIPLSDLSDLFGSMRVEGLDGPLQTILNNITKSE
ncbi:uncharacterized protein ZBAI_05854 [Zygosaccharomyces bailii ISA1307]|nr:uncharacterized protein ZBAI_05854 [Zygosaccharomyces bailii ISA1307]